MNGKGKLFLIPAPLGDAPLDGILPRDVLQTACSLTTFVVEQTRTARRTLSAYGLKGKIDTLEFHELNEHTTQEEVDSFLPLFDRGSVGYISEAGLPAVADPGSALVELCHRNGIEVVPLVGPSSLMLALMASGLNGQSFAFRGYVPAKNEERKAALRGLEKVSRSEKQSQIVIEPPYRNDTLFADMLQTLSPRTRLCVAADITLPTQFIRTLSIAEWKGSGLVIGKRPCVFIFLA